MAKSKSPNSISVGGCFENLMFKLVFTHEYEIWRKGEGEGNKI